MSTKTKPKAGDDQQKKNEGLTKVQRQMVAWTSALVLAGATWFASARAGVAPEGLYPFPPQCRSFPGDRSWPAARDWDAFNRTVGGRLIATVPIGAVCHDTFPGVRYDAQKCAEVRDLWPKPELHELTTHSTMAAIWANMSCDPFTARDAPCSVGTYVQYAVKATGADDYRKTIAFATKNNIRLVIRNTGHDYMGKSTGAGALALWTHHIKDKSIVNYKSSYYTGKAMKMGAGVSAGEAQELANSQGLLVVDGDCPTVGIAGGYLQGGGSSPLGSKFGLGADSVLEWEVVTADGKLVTATPTNQYSDLYWALSGGGGGTFGAVLSVTVRLHKNLKTAGATLQFVEPEDGKLWKVLPTFLNNLSALVRAGASVYWQVVPPAYTGLPGNFFTVPQLYFPGGTVKELEKLLDPTFKVLKSNGIQYAYAPKAYDNFQDAFVTLNPYQNITEFNIGGRLIPHSLVSNPKSAGSLSDAIKKITTSGGIFAGVSADVSKPPPVPNSANPEWRKSVFLAFYGIPYDRTSIATNVASQKIVTEILTPPLEALTPGGGAYLNEADIYQPNWQSNFYGSNYPRLLLIKNKYDPAGAFWAPTAVGSEGWSVASDGRLCKKTGWFFF
ncbi:putative FAD-linked oxidoreductase [Cladorrhinum sp. PSN259]|nr:putative FAD-linked oxidoreductase [Cladorrhinum sp. PSN259]